MSFISPSQNEIFWCLPIWSAHRKKIHTNPLRILRTKNFGVVVEKSTRGQMEDGRVTVGFIAIFVIFSYSHSELGLYYVLVREVHNFSISPAAHTHYSKSIKNFFRTAHNAPSLIHLQRHFPSEGAPPTIELSWRENFSSNEGWKKIIYFIEKFSKAKSLFLLLSLWCAKNSLSFNWHNARIMFWLYSKERSNVREKMRLRLIMEKKIWWTSMLNNTNTGAMILLKFISMLLEYLELYMWNESL